MLLEEFKAQREVYAFLRPRAGRGSSSRPRDMRGSEAGSVKGAKHPRRGLPLTGSAERLRSSQAGECGKVDMRCTEGVQRLFSLAVTLVDETIGFLGNVFFQEMSIVGDDGFQAIIEHDSSGVEITVGLAYPFRRPDRTDDMRVPVFAGVTVDNP